MTKKNTSHSAQDAGTYRQQMPFCSFGRPPAFNAPLELRKKELAKKKTFRVQR